MVPVQKQPRKHQSGKHRIIRPMPSIRPALLQKVGWMIVGAVATIAILAAGSFWKQHVLESKRTSATHTVTATTGGKLVYYPGRNIDYGSKFSAPNDTHLAAAKAAGVPDAPLKDESDVMAHKNKLVKITSGKNYVVEDLTHSLPYLTKPAARELEAIANEFADILQRNGLPHYRVIVTSVLRTEENVQKLKKSGNVNASSNSAHCYGTTFDLTYSRYDKDDSDPNYMNEGNLKLVLGQALLNEQRKDRIYVKHEVKQACFHITCRL